MGGRGIEAEVGALSWGIVEENASGGAGIEFVGRV